jgi:Domain of unknown function (DUF4386)
MYGSCYIGTAVALFPVPKRYSEVGALGYIGARIVESTFIAVGLLALIAVVLLRQEPGDAGFVEEEHALMPKCERMFLEAEQAKWDDCYSNRDYVSITVLIGRAVVMGSAWRCATFQVSPSRRKIMVTRSVNGTMSSLPGSRA